MSEIFGEKALYVDLDYQHDGGEDRVSDTGITIRCVGDNALAKATEALVEAMTVDVEIADSSSAATRSDGHQK